MSSLIVEICKIEELEERSEAERLVYATVKGWKTWVSKGSFRAGDLCIYIPVDALVPEETIQRFQLAYLKNGGRVYAAKIRGVYSEGIALAIPEDKKNVWTLGKDVAEELGIKKYEPPPPNVTWGKGRRGSSATRKATHPLFRVYTDIENLKNYPDVLQEGEEVVISSKTHGTNWRGGWLPKQYPRNMWGKLLKWIDTITSRSYEFLVGSHNVQLGPEMVSNAHQQFFSQCSSSPYARVVYKYLLRDKMPKGYVFYGEVYGQGIQKDFTYGCNDDVSLKIFDIFDTAAGRYLDHNKALALFEEANLGLSVEFRGPVLYRGPWTPDLLSISSGIDPLDNKTIREGIVITPTKERWHPKVGRVIFKCISPEYNLLKNKTEYH